jgi:YD repeat-containing protein
VGRAGNAVAVTDPRGDTTTEAVGPDNQPVGDRDLLGNTATWAYAPAGNRTAVTDPRGQTTAFGFDPAKRPVNVTDPSGDAATAYDAAGQVLSVTDADGHVTRYAYDAPGRLTSRQYALTITTGGGNNSARASRSIVGDGMAAEAKAQVERPMADLTISPGRLDRCMPDRELSTAPPAAPNSLFRSLFLSARACQARPTHRGATRQGRVMEQGAVRQGVTPAASDALTRWKSLVRIQCRPFLKPKK